MFPDSIVPYLVVCVVALLVSALTLYSGFGLGTLLMPAFALFFPVEVAVAATAIVHLLTNLFKFGLLWKHADTGVVVRFALPGAVLAVVGASLLTALADLPVLAQYSLANHTYSVAPSRLVIGVLILFFALVELVPVLGGMVRFGEPHLLLGGAISGFLGGLSGHQGALRSAVLIRCGLEKEAFIATGVACAAVVDLSRLAVYGVVFYAQSFGQLTESGGIQLAAAATAAACVGVSVSKRLMTKVTMHSIHRLVGVMLVLLAVTMAAGLI
jgi:uncharacterized membrane protein YfcA